MGKITLFLPQHLILLLTGGLCWPGDSGLTGHVTSRALLARWPPRICHEVPHWTWSLWDVSLVPAVPGRSRGTTTERGTASVLPHFPCPRVSLAFHPPVPFLAPALEHKCKLCHRLGSKSPQIPGTGRGMGEGWGLPSTLLCWHSTEGLGRKSPAQGIHSS